MSTGAILMMAVTMAIVTVITVWFFVKVLRTPPRADQAGHD